MDWVFVSSKIHVLNPNPQWDGIGGGIMGRWLGHEGGTHISEISALTEETSDSSCAPYNMRTHWEDGHL